MKVNSEGSIGTFEAVCMVTIVIITKIFYSSVSVVVANTGTAAWYSTIIACLTGMFFFFLIYLLMKRFPGYNIAEIFETVVGKVLGKILTLIFSMYFIFYIGSVAREFIEMIKVYNLPYTPPSLIMAVFLIVTAILVYYGFEVLARVSVLCFFPFLLGLFLILVLSYKNYDIHMVAPYLGYGITNTLKFAFMRSSTYNEFFILAVVINSLHGVKAYKKAGIVSLVISGICFTSSFLCYLLVFGYNMGKENVSGLFELTRSIAINRFIERLEPIFLFVWVFLSVISVSIVLYIAISLYCKAFKISRHRPLILPFIFLTFMVALIPRNVVELIKINITIIRTYSLFLIYFVPILVLIIALIRGKKGEKPDEESV